MHDVNDLLKHLADMRAGVEQSVIDDAIDQRADVSVPAFEPQEDVLNINWHKSVETFKFKFKFIVNPLMPEFYFQRENWLVLLLWWMYWDKFSFYRQMAFYMIFLIVSLFRNCGH